ncbi:Signal transduction response regulator [Enterobacter cloacae]
MLRGWSLFVFKMHLGVNFMPLNVLITQDSYLFHGLKHCISLKHIQDLTLLETSHRECVVLVDSRMPMNDLEHGWRFLSAMFERTKAIMLCMNQPVSLPFSVKPCGDTVDMKTSPENISLMILNKISIAMPDKWSPPVRIKIEEREVALINAFLCGKDIEEMATMFCCSQKEVYKFRDKVCQRLNVRHFYIACLYIFRHGLLQRSYTLPETWLWY